MVSIPSAYRSSPSREKTFCSGYDLGSIPASGQKQTGHKDSAFENVMDRIEAMRMPTLCALNGSVYGGATDMALACDFRLGVKGMRFFMPAARFGLHYYPSGLRRYTQKVSPSFAKRAFLLSEDFTDEALLRVGYLDWLVDRSEFAGLETSETAEVTLLAKNLSGRNNHSKVAYGTEGGLFSEAGVPTVVIGPGSIDQAHKADEFIAVSELEKCGKFLDRLIEHCAR